MELGILNVGAGDTKISFDPKKPAEVKRASKVVQDMLKRGYAIFVEVGKDEKGPLFRRATAFDSKTAEYLIVGVPEDEEEEASVQRKAIPPAQSRRGKKSSTRRVPAASTKAVAVARTAGG